MAARVKHGVTTAATVATVTLSVGWERVNIVNRGGGDLFVSLTSTVPTVSGDDFDVVPANTTVMFPVRVNVTDQGAGDSRPSTTVVNLISTPAVTYSVVGF